MTLTVLCVWVRGHVPFTAEYVTRLRSMARRALPHHRFVCLTDQSNKLPPDMETVEASAPGHLKGWWSKVRLFDPGLPLYGRLLYLDLDVLLVGDMTHVVNYPARFALAPDGAPAFRPRDGTVCVKRFNSSVMVWDHGVHPELFKEWNQHVAHRLWGDQDWIGERAPEASPMPAEWFPRLSAAVSPPWPSEAKVILCKKPKNAEAASKWPWFDKEWN